MPEIADAWHRITDWLQHRAPDSYAGLRTGAGPAAIATVEGALGLRILVELHVLWLMTAGDDGADGWGCLPGSEALMPLETVADTNQRKMRFQAEQVLRNADLPEEERIHTWKPSWIPLVGLGPDDRTSGRYLDTQTGYPGRWSRYNEPSGEELDTPITYLEAAADMLESPALATRDRPGLLGGTPVWWSSIDLVREDRWRPVTE
ncbi:hypothetical protein ACIQNG_26325 [Streptomyces sp. NPDC091377]|uniref:hypothetical protein n=1 Tax=Streptomyces sp. NPDC091377 TaxID=3365995 RepID=UPI00382F5801